MALSPKKPEREIIGIATVNVDLVNVRKQPTKTAPILREAKKGERFNVTNGSTNQFTAVIVDDVISYIMTQYLDVVTN